MSDSEQVEIKCHKMDALGKDEFYEGFSRDGELLDEAVRTDSPRPHIVFDMAEMMRYIVFREIAYEKGQ